jgi:hypothetical protein
VVGDAALEDDVAWVEAFALAVSQAQQAVIDDPEAGLEAAIEAVPTISEDVDTARTVLLATVELWASDLDIPPGFIDADVWEAGYATMEHLGFIDGSVPLEDMYWHAIRLE